MGRCLLLEHNLDTLGAYHLSRIQRFELELQHHYISTIKLFSGRKTRAMLAEAHLESAEAYFIGENCLVTLTEPPSRSPPVGDKYEPYMEFCRGVVGTVASHLERMIQGRSRPYLTADDLIMLVEIWEDALRHLRFVLMGSERWISGRWTSVPLS